MITTINLQAKFNAVYDELGQLISVTKDLEDQGPFLIWKEGAIVDPIYCDEYLSLGYDFLPKTELAQSGYRNWDKLVNELRSTPVWARIYVSSGISLKANTAVTLLMNTLSHTRNEQDFIFGWNDLRAELTTNPTLEDFTSEELTFARELVSSCGFAPAQFNLI